MSSQRRVDLGSGAVPSAGLERRETVCLLLASGLTAALDGRSALAATPAAKSPPQPGDGLVFAEGERKGQPVTASSLEVGGPLAVAWAKDAASGTVRNGTRLYRILVLRLDPASLDGKTRHRAVDGIVAYSGFCTHAGCPIQHFKPAEQLIYCHCHFSHFDPRANGKVASGPARRSLAGLALRLEGDLLVVAGAFEGKLGAPKA